MEIIIITVLLGLFGAVIFYVSKIFSKTGETSDNVNNINNHEQIVNDKNTRRKSESTTKKNIGQVSHQHLSFEN